MPIEISAYDYNHPKSYIGYVVAFKLGGSRDAADRLTEEYVVGGAGMARRGAQNMGLLSHEREGRDHSYSLTDRGEWLCSEAPERFGAADLEGVLEEFDTMRGARGRFVDRFPEFAEIAPDVLFGDAAVEHFADLLEEVHQDRLFVDRDYAVGTSELFWELWERDAKFAGDLLIRDHDGIREIVLGSQYAGLESGEGADPLDIGQYESIEYGAMPHDGTPVYRSAATFQLKNLMWHMGVLQSKGVQSKEIAGVDFDPDEMTWALEAEMIDRRPVFVSDAEVKVDG